jgi:hypothetical protein
VSHDAPYVRRFARLPQERVDRRGRVTVVPLRLDDGVTDLDRPLLVDERATDLTDDNVILEAVEKEGTELPLGADALRHAR